jgi:hypothetical protein
MTRHASLVILAMVLWLPQQAMAQERISVSAEVGGTARYFAQDQVGDPNAFGLEFGARTELNILAHLKADVRYSDGAIFSSQEFRQFDLSFSGSTPALLVFALDVHELYYRLGSRPGDDLFYLHTGLGIKGKVLGRLKASLGFTYIQDDGPLDMLDSTRALGAYAGVEHMVRSKSIDTNLRGESLLLSRKGCHSWVSPLMPTSPQNSRSAQYFWVQDSMSRIAGWGCFQAIISSRNATR